ncbi:MAG: radical SAM protein [Methanomicrobiales archaeon]|nr:radical SAM protein [Methanomicrobiales archaeon]
MRRKADPAVALIYPYFRENDPVDLLFPPLGIASLASQLREFGIPTRIFDCTFETFSDAVERIAAFKPSIVGISVMVTLSGPAFRLRSALANRLPEALFLAGGPLPTVHPGPFADRFDAVFRGEADVTFPQFCRDYLALPEGGLEGLELSRYPGIYLHTRSGTLSLPPIHHPVSVLDTLPLPDRSDLPHSLYQRHWQTKAGCRATSILITRGCPFSCDFCSRPVWGDLFRKPSLDRVFEEIRQILALGYDRLWIADDCFTLDTEFLLSFCRRMIDERLPITWTCLSRVDRLNRQLAEQMRDAGCVRVYLGLESGSDQTLQLMGKRTTVADGISAARLFHAAGIETAGFFIVGYPGESVESIESTFSLALSLPLSSISFNVPLPLPGTPLFSRVMGDTPMTDWSHANEVRFLYPSEFDEAWLRKRIEDTLEKFRRRRAADATEGIDMHDAHGEGDGADPDRFGSLI